MYMMAIYKILVGSILLSCVCCNSSKGQKDLNMVDGDSLELPLPEVPAGITEAGERARFVALHFWDGLDFRRDARSRDTAFMEQNFVNFIALLPYTSEEDAGRAVGRLLDSAAVDDKASSLLAGVADRYLADPNSPMRSEEIYMLFLRHTIASDKTDEARKARAEARLEQAMKNRPGTKGADFRMLAKDGKATSLMAEVARDTTLVMFYDPDCAQCREFTPELEKSETARRFRMLAVDVAADRKLWEATRSKFPPEWEVAFAIDPVEDDEIYVIPALPTLYLIAPDGTIILKDIPLGEIR